MDSIFITHDHKLFTVQQVTIIVYFKIVYFPVAKNSREPF